MIRCLVVDDEPAALELMTRYVKNTPFLELVQATTRPQEAVETAVREGVSLVFLDVEMPRLNGFGVAKLLREQCHFICCSAHNHYALEGFNNDVCDFLLKPVSYERFLQAVGKVKRQLGSLPRPQPPPEPEYLLLKGNGKYRYQRILLNDIDYIEGAGHYQHIFVHGKKKTFLIALKELLQRLPENRFVRIHHSYIVPLCKISYLDADELGLYPVRHALPVGQTYRENLFRRLTSKG